MDRLSLHRDHHRNLHPRCHRLAERRKYRISEWLVGVQQHDLVDRNNRPIPMEFGLQQIVPGEGLQRFIKLFHGV